jgi:outer membrane protein OmpA-like peptidoglycan-associated protein
VKQLGVYFSKEEFELGMTFDQQGIIDSTFRKGISGTLNWIPIQGDYVADGGEKYVIIGNFRSKMTDDFVKRKKWDLFDLREAYYYVDDISVRKILTDADSVNAVKMPDNKVTPIMSDTFVTGQIVEIKNIQFQNGSAKLLKSSHAAMDELVRVLNDHPFMEIQINGHTDNEGNESANIKLSKKRAKAVFDYLQSEGIISPMTYKGFGSSKPIAPNDTEENRAKNRRVELLIIKQ